jgi:hypothetical protein
MKDVIDLGHDHTMMWVDWDPDLELNPKFAHLADQLPARFTVIVSHRASDGSSCESGITLDIPIAREAGFADRSLWQVESFDPPTFSPSLLCGRCGDHGFIREGRWVPA